MKDCIFCKIVNRESKVNIVFENEAFLVFTALEPVSKGHVLIIPKKHFNSIFDIDERTLSSLMIIAKKLAVDVVKEKNATGINILHASGKDAQQSVFHFHIHLVPRYPNDGLDLWLRKTK